MWSRGAQRDGALTLLELLIVVAALGILATLAAVHYSRSLVASQVARVESDLRTLEVGIQSYIADHNRVPRMAHFDFYGDPEFDRIQGEFVRGVLSRSLSTPVAYVTQPHMMDPFMKRNTGAPLDERLYTYHDMEAYIEYNPDSSFWPLARQFYGRWRLGSVGPSQTYSHGFANSAQLPYDPTNGTQSAGNIWRSERGHDEFPPVPQLLGEH